MGVQTEEEVEQEDVEKSDVRSAAAPSEHHAQFPNHFLLFDGSLPSIHSTQKLVGAVEKGCTIHGIDECGWRTAPWYSCKP